MVMVTPRISLCYLSLHHKFILQRPVQIVSIRDEYKLCRTIKKSQFKCLSERLNQSNLRASKSSCASLDCVPMLTTRYTYPIEVTYAECTHRRMQQVHCVVVESSNIG